MAKKIQSNVVGPCAPPLSFNTNFVRQAWAAVVDAANDLREAVADRQKADRIVKAREIKLRTARDAYKRVETAMFATLGLPSKDAFNEQSPSAISDDDDCDCDRSVKRDC